MNTTERPTPRTNAAFDAFSRGACGTAYLCAKMAELERELAHANQETAFYSDACDRNAELVAEAKKQNEAMRAAIQETLMENLHLADGDTCTLKRLKDAIGFSLPKTPCQPSK
jgi:hypothetical protein